MRGLAAIIALAVVVAGCGAKKHAPATTAAAHPRQAAAPFRLSFSAPTHSPRAGRAKWFYSVKALDSSGRLVPGRLTVAVVDPLGTAHVAAVGTTTRKLRNYAFSGTYHDFMRWPRASRGYPLTVRVVVKAAGATQTLTYAVRPQ